DTGSLDAEERVGRRGDLGARAGTRASADTRARAGTRARPRREPRVKAQGLEPGMALRADPRLLEDLALERLRLREQPRQRRVAAARGYLRAHQAEPRVRVIG